MTDLQDAIAALEEAIRCLDRHNEQFPKNLRSQSIYRTADDLARIKGALRAHQGEDR